MLFIFSFLLVPFTANAAITGDLNCTTYNGTSFVYTPAAVACSNTISDAACEVLYVDPDTTAGYPSAGTDAQRPLACYTTATATPAAIVQDMKTAALDTCAKTCGLCCQTDAYSCANVAYPRLDCSTITTAQCNSVIWRSIIATDCPSACGFCNEGGCVDAVVDCATDISICTTVGMQDFVNTYCQRTCGRCPSSTTSSSTTTASPSSSTCTSYNADSSSHCADWAANGFCTNTFYTSAQRKSYCASTCKIC
ncbi:Protein CBG10417 [Caenorhabditis briggsae]|uniref:Protein CBG10417 n=2 Tax=Caenorhabditis briggsae TaxID=6238 RepID=A8XB58_CAEBR|nr:Protein CBG10417 [Caenorhabditis briggsae]ULT87169.1 hypothetical protein L3Y34_006747 [Caenorhabditis briggsae]CAP29838.1 Protein CBG10417 [Caenorhabditis briggsae]